MNHPSIDRWWFSIRNVPWLPSSSLSCLVDTLLEKCIDGIATLVCYHSTTRYHQTFYTYLWFEVVVVILLEQCLLSFVVPEFVFIVATPFRRHHSRDKDSTAMRAAHFHWLNVEVWFKTLECSFDFLFLVENNFYWKINSCFEFFFLINGTVTHCLLQDRACVHEMRTWITICNKVLGIETSDGNMGTVN